MKKYSINFLCRESKANKMGLSPIECVISINGRRTSITTSHRMTTEDYLTAIADKKVNRVKNLISQMYTEYQTKIEDGWTIDDIKRGSRIVGCSLQRLFNEFINVQCGRVKAGEIKDSTVRKYRDVRKRFVGYVGSERINVDEIDNALIRGYYFSLFDSLDTNTIKGHMMRLKCIFSYAEDNGWCEVKSLFKNIKPRRIEKTIEIMSEDEYISFRDCSLSPCLEKVRDLCIFLASSGLAYIDAASLDYSSIEQVGGQYIIRGDRIKTGKGYTSVILDDGIEILKKYNWDLSGIVISNQKTNLYLKSIGLGLGIKPEKCHVHQFRHYYITRLIKMGISTEIVAKCAGHSSTTMTQKYIHLKGMDVVNAFASC